MSPTETVLQFMDRINERDVDKLAELMTEDHVFIDSLGNSVRSREKMYLLEFSCREGVSQDGELD